MIIAGHSQGAMLGERLLKEYFDSGEERSKLIVAYITGWPIPINYFKKLQVCKSDTDTHCFCGWRTFQKGYIPSYVRSETSKSYVTNPLSWKTDTAYVNKKANLGSVLTHFDKIIPHTTDARVHEGVLWVSKPKFPGSIFLRTKNYHIGDINLFYLNIRSNIEKRILTYKSQ